jgi:ATP-dependent Clp endopeptidase proteolytic subunit ClpP
MFASLMLVASLGISTNLVVTPQKANMDCEKETCLVSIKQPIVIEVNEFTEDSAKTFARQMAYGQSSGQTVIPIIIDSYGGQVYALSRMMSLIQSSKVPVATIVEGKAMSCGAVLFAMGNEGLRYAGPSATILFHDISTGVEGKVGDVKVGVAQAEKLEYDLMAIVSKNTGHPAGFFAEMLAKRGHTDWFMDVSEAKRINVVNHIGIPAFKLQVGAWYTLE